MNPISNNWQTAASLKARRLKVNSEAARQAIFAAADSATNISLELQKRELHAADLRRNPRPDDMANRRLANVLAEIEALTAGLAEARAYTDELSNKAQALISLANRAEKALAQAQGQQLFTNFGGAN